MHKKMLFYFESDLTLEKIAQRACRIFILADI